MEIYIGRDGQRLGSFPPDEVRRRLTNGEILPTDLAWAEGQPNWVPLATFPGLIPAGPPPLQTRTPVPAWQPPSTARETSGLAIASLILGILSVTFVPVLLGIPAVVCGHMSLSQIKKAAGRIGGGGMAIAGLIMGYLSCALLPVIAVVAIFAAGIALPVFGEVRIRGQQTQSLSQAKQIATACKIFAVDHDGVFPKTLLELVPDYLPDATTFVCPLSPTLPIGYDYFGGREDDPPEQVLLISKGNHKGKRIVIRVSGAGAVEKDPVALPVK